MLGFFGDPSLVGTGGEGGKKRDAELKDPSILKSMCHIKSYVMCHMSYVICHM